MLQLKNAFLGNEVSVNKKAEQIRFRLLQLLIVMLPFNILYTNIALYLLIATTLLDLDKDKLKKIPKQVWIFQVIYFLALLGYFYSFNKSSAGFLLERQLTILIVPLLLPLALELTEIRKKQLLNAFTSSLVVTICYLLIMAGLTVKELNLPMKSIFSKEFFNHQFSAPIGIHAGYLSLYVSICILYISQVLMQKMAFMLRMLLIGSLLILTLGLFFLASRNIIIASFLIMSFVFPWFFIKKKILFFSSVIIFLIVTYFIVSHITYLSERFSSDLITDIKFSNGTTYNYDGSEPRIKRWECAMELITQSPLIGYGTGDEIPLLKAKYIEKGLYISYLESFNAHNQYLSYLLKNGIVGLVIFLAAFVYYLWIALKSKSFIYLSFLILLLIGFSTENILDANKGIFFFAFFNTILGYSLLNKTKVGVNEIKD